jgi:branched-chain amino acid transport system permease protein
MGRYSARLAGLVVAVVLISATFFVAPNLNDWIFRCAMVIMLAISWDMMASAGLLSLGHSAFWGFGGYASVLSARAFGLPIVASLILSLIAGAVLGVSLALVTGRLRGVFFAISTLALSEGLRVIALMWPELTQGAVGVFVPHEIRPDVRILSLIAVLCALSTILVAYLVSKTSFHYACRAMRNHEGAAQMLGIDPFRYRIRILALSGAIASCAGGASAWYGGYLDPNIAFNLQVTIQAQIAPILGGIYSVAGPVIGSIGMVALSEVTRIWLGAHEGTSQLAFGIILVTCVLFMPQGVYGAWRRFTLRTSGHRSASTNIISADPTPELSEKKR